MGEKKVQVAKDSGIKAEFTDHLLKDIQALDYLMDHDLIESGVQRLGAEQELCFIDQNYRPCFCIDNFQKQEKDPHYTPEFLKFNLEFNLEPLELKGKCLSRLEKDLNHFMDKAEKVVETWNAGLILTGILPTIKIFDLKEDSLTPTDRFKALIETISRSRGGSFELHIKGIDELVAKVSSARIEGVNTSFQIHFQLEPRRAVDQYNWAMLISGPVMSCATNSPLLFGKRLWHETRVALFQQSFDVRRHQDIFRKRIPRVTFGNQWIKHSITKIFKEDLARHKVLLSTTVQEDPQHELEEERIPQLAALKTHNSTIYKWNRLCYDVTGGKAHLRLENRLFPSGPTLKDEVANSAFWLGLMAGMPDEYAMVPRSMDFDDVHNNFLKAARMGLGAQFVWKRRKRITARELINDELLPISEVGLKNAGVNNKDIQLYLGIIKERVRTGQNGSRWMLDSYAKLIKKGTREQALVAVTAGMHKRQKKGNPVHTWNLSRISEAGGPARWCSLINQIMSTDLITVQEDDLVDLVSNIMDWKHITHLPIENAESELVGLITSGMLIHYLAEKDNSRIIFARDIMIKNPVTVSPETPTLEALQLMLKKKIGCLPVVQENRLVGIVTEHDMVRISSSIFRELSNINA